jgi:hypothetical protein
MFNDEMLQKVFSDVTFTCFYVFQQLKRVAIYLYKKVEVKVNSPCYGPAQTPKIS